MMASSFSPQVGVWGDQGLCVEFTELSASDDKSFPNYFVSPYRTILADFTTCPPIPLGRVSWWLLTGLS